MPTKVPSPILFVLTRADSLGGAQIHVRDLALEYRRRQADVHVAVGQAGVLSEYLENQGFKVHRIPSLIRPIHPIKDAAAVLQLRRLYRRLSPQLVSAHTAKAGMVARLARGFGGPPVVFTAHGWQFAEGIGFGQKLAVLAVERLCAPLSHRIIVVSQYDFDLARKIGIAGPPRMICVHNGMPDVPPPHRTVWDARRDLRLIMVARFQEQKDHPTLFRALSLLRDRPWRLDLVGDGPLMDQAKDQCQRLELSDRVRFLGQAWNVAELLAENDVFLLISHWEGFPRSILEAMRAAMPVIASEVGGVPESVKKGVSGWLVPRGNHQLLADALRFYFEHPDSVLRHGQAGRKLYEQFFRFETMVEATLRAYNL